MLASAGELGIIGGIIVLAVVLLLVLRPLSLHITVRHLRDDDRDKEE